MEARNHLADAFGKVLRQLRHEAGMTQEALSFAAGMQRTYVSELELGQQVPSLSTVLKISAALARTGEEVVFLVEAELVARTSAQPGRARFAD